MAKGQGLDINANDFHRIAADLHNKLSEADLDAVAGGGFLGSVVSAVSSVVSAVTHAASASDTAIYYAAALAAE